MRRTHRRIATAIVAPLLMTLGSVGCVPEPNPGPTTTTTTTVPAGPVVLSEGHADAFALELDGDDLELQVHAEGATEEDPEVAYDPADVVLQAVPEAETTVPSDPAFAFLGAAGAPTWILPDTETEGLLAPGWAAEDIDAGLVTGDSLDLRIQSISGPGTVHVYDVDEFGVPDVIVDSGASFPQTITVATPSHTHAFWAFSAEGTYTITADAVGSLLDGTPLSTGVKTFTFVVGPYSA